MNKITYQVEGMHCASCELVIERTLLSLAGIISVNISRKRNLLTLEFSGINPPDLTFLNSRLSALGYKLYHINNRPKRKLMPRLLIVTGSILVSLAIYFLIQKIGLSGIIRVDKSSSLPTFFVFGLLAGTTTCAALAGSVVLSLSKNWNSQSDTTWQRLKPHIFFNLGRAISYALFGAILSLIGSVISLTSTGTAVIIILVSGLLFVIAVQNLGINLPNFFALNFSKNISKKLLKIKGNNLLNSAILGFLTFFLPCGFTLTVQGLALLSGSVIQGSAMMFSFALGTIIPLFLIGAGSSKIYSNPKWSRLFGYVIATFLILFAFINFKAAFTILNKNITFFSNNSQEFVASIPYNEENFQVIKMDANAKGYSPNRFTVKSGIPVKWEIYDSGTSGCTNAIIAKDLFLERVNLTVGETTTKEFLPTKSGLYRFSCWMGMVSGTIEVTD